MSKTTIGVMVGVVALVLLVGFLMMRSDFDRTKANTANQLATRQAEITLTLVATMQTP